MTDYVFEVFVAGASERSRKAVSVLTDVCERELPGRYHISVIDVLEYPERAEHRRVFATPTVIKLMPPPGRRIIGELTQSDKIRVGLDLRPAASA
jgi:circadian clock protein KaiB